MHILYKLSFLDWVGIIGSLMIAGAYYGVSNKGSKISYNSNYEISFDDVLSNISHRDKQDINRKNSPLKKASDSIVIFTDNFTLDQLEEKLLSYVTPLISKK